MSGISIICFAACYAIAFGLEIVGLLRRAIWQRVALFIAVLAGLLAHTLYLAHAAAGTGALRLSTAEWLLWAAWLLAVVYLAALLYLPRTPNGVVLLPIALFLTIGSHWANAEPMAASHAFHVWGTVHWVLLLLGTVAVSVGFLAGLMYLVQSYALKHASSPINGLRLPSLEWLERVNSRTLGLSAVLIALGFASGLVMTYIIHRGDTAYTLWTDPVVLSLAAMLIWLVAAEVFRLVYPAARRGRKVAYLTLASFVFLVIALASFILLDSVHGSPRQKLSIETAINCRLQTADCHLRATFNPKSTT
jgi:ABC-type uncharacterized transport system permease subunit